MKINFCFEKFQQRLICAGFSEGESSAMIALNDFYQFKIGEQDEINFANSADDISVLEELTKGFFENKERGYNPARVEQLIAHVLEISSEKAEIFTLTKIQYLKWLDKPSRKLKT